MKTIFKKHKLPLYDIRFMKPHLACIIINGAPNFWIGQICYGDRAFINRVEGWRVNPDSIIDYRKDIARKLMILTNDYFNHDSRQPISWRGVLTCFIRFINWCDKNIDQDAIRLDMVVSSYKRYVQNLIESVQASQIKSLYAVVNEMGVREVIEHIYDLNNIDNGVIKPVNKNDSNPTPPPDIHRKTQNLTLLNSIFDSSYDLCVKGEPFPFQMKIRGINTNLSEEKVIWLFPATKKFISPQENKNPSFSFGAYDFITGRILTIPEIETIKNISKKNAYRSHQRAVKNLQKHNTQLHSKYRIEQGRIGGSAFKLLFIANTGMNLEQATKLQWNDNYTLDKTRSGFKRIKYRAGNKDVYFEIQNIFIKMFKRYISLRSYLLNGNTSDLLFLESSCNFTYDKNLKDFLKKISPTFRNITSREWRASKSDWLINNTDITTTANILQNSESTVKKHYLKGSHTDHINEMGNFLETMLDRIIPPSVTATSSAIGSCLKPLTPVSNSSESIIKPDCKQPEGCLFCDKFVIHSDEIDIRKLLSCKYCILQSRSLCDSIQQFESLYGAVLTRIDSVVNELKNSTESKVITESIERDVFENENLDPYWECKVSMIINLGIM
jgi:hypothetical protein